MMFLAERIATHLWPGEPLSRIRLNYKPQMMVLQMGLVRSILDLQASFMTHEIWTQDEICKQLYNLAAEVNSEQARLYPNDKWTLWPHETEYK